MEKQDLQTGESQWQNSNSTTSYTQEQNTPRHESRNGFKPSSRLIRLKNNGNILG